MSITINIYYKGRNGLAKEFVKEMISSGIVDSIKAEEGNERYEYYFSESAPETVLLVDKWRDQAALDIHHASDLMEKILDLREKYHLSAKAERFETLSEIPDKDKKYTDN